MQAWTVVVALLVLLTLTVGGILLTLLGRRRAVAERAEALAGTAALQERLDALERRLATPPASASAVEDRNYVITRIGSDDEESDRLPATRVDGPLFADLVLRESVVQAASLVAGLRRALAPEIRNRIRFEMKREVKRARKQRRADLRGARRDWEARQRAGTLDEGSAA
ncbi:hypothetical protein SAMN05216561_11269 [Nocardioides psychrotolerans]|uniref:Uncharacterized protein n=1 Tax=Nocardioides psychrotolerans TaxID=1005945 RepID=A0A1I3KKD8_9ACTN|nr:hypothetical protein SAMN05216561_11269 [Nocardioides psychrotolerans]